MLSTIRPNCRYHKSTHKTNPPNVLFTVLKWLELLISWRQIVLTIPKEDLHLYYHLPITCCICSHTPNCDFHYKGSNSALMISMKTLWVYVCTIALREPHLYYCCYGSDINEDTDWQAAGRLSTRVHRHAFSATAADIRNPETLCRYITGQWMIRCFIF